MPSSCRIKVEQNSEAKPNIFAVSFTNGVLASHTSGRNLNTSVYQSANNSDVKKLVLSAGEMDYVGNFDTSKRDPGKYIGVEDVESGEMTLIPLKRIRLRPAISVAQEGIEEEVTTPAMTKQQQSDSLIESFGGAKQRMNMIRRQRHGIDKDMINDALDAAQVEQLNVSMSDTPEKKRKTDEETSILPPHDLEATEVDLAYPLEGHFPGHVSTALTDYAEDFANARTSDIEKWKKESGYPELVIDQLQKLPLAEKERKKVALCIKFLFFLIKLYKMKPTDLRNKDPFKPKDAPDAEDIMPSACLNYLLQTFTTKTGRGRSIPARLKDKLLVVILLIALRLEQYTMSAKLLLSDLHISSRKLITVAKGMGCKVALDKKNSETEDPTIVIALKVPLVFPKSRSVPPKRR